MPEGHSLPLFSHAIETSPHYHPCGFSFTPAQVAAQLCHREGFIWMDSSLATPGAISILTAEPVATLQGHIDHDWEKVRSALRIPRASAGGLYGWVGYDGHFTFGIYPHGLVYHHDTSKWYQFGDFKLPNTPTGARTLLSASAPSSPTGARPLQPASTPRLPKGARALLPASAPSPPTGARTLLSAPPPSLHFQPALTSAEFIRIVQRAQDYITAGDIYQVNLSYPWHAHWPQGADPLALYLKLRTVSPAPHAAFMQLAGTTVLSASPELFLRMQGSRIATRPIKGTRPRFAADPARDEAAVRELTTSPKERAELLMITDLQRNDLGQVCEFGSVSVPELWRVESFAQVFHLVSTVTGTLRPHIDHVDAFRACFPGGSITGAPKKRATEIITELEPHPRGLYTGAIGWFGFDGRSQWNIAIRTAVQKENQITFHVGSGIVADSVPQHEYEETLHKAAGILAAAG
ncbi:aminodeoxychorismate synthase component I [Prosthecobacter sp.]|uniref:aminodeoxychorismate synthase component I n=1 Tax=Prosthecobacter sp. TaxID=1965333 RepID=UPI0037838AE8